MPTYSFIHDRFRDHQAGLAGGGVAPRRPLTPCPVCGAHGADIEWLSQHLRDAHPLAAPLLAIDGRPVAQLSTVALRSAIAPGSITTANATRAEVSIDGRSPERVSLGDLGGELEHLETALVRIDLWNERADGAEARRRFELSLAIPRSDELDAADRCFASAVGARTVPADLDRFADCVAGLSTAGAYADALHAYLRGILQKDGRLSGHGFEFARHRDELARAVHELDLQPGRPLADAVAGVARFNLNRLPLPRPSGIPQLDACADDLVAVAQRRDAPSTRAISTDVAGDCPVDDSTHALLQLHADLGERGRRRAALTALLRLAEAPRTTPADAVKARALALRARSEMTDDERRRSAAALVNDRLFGSFAATVLGS
jgi:hypothetical protein